MSVVMAAGVFVIWREHRLGRRGQARAGQAVDRRFQAEQQLGIGRQAMRAEDPFDLEVPVGPLAELVEKADVPAAQGPAVEAHGDLPRHRPAVECPGLRPDRSAAASDCRLIRASDRALHQADDAVGLR